ncbi:hypothetical protein C2W62_24145 [Candidatus Entotheonella serta]|nr:hypothetical protein C2W62_24145 [Candidatus Entotheonella serta]
MSTLTQMAKDLVMQHIAVGQLMPEQMPETLKSTFETLQQLQQSEMGPGETAAETGASESQVLADWQKSINKHSVRCLECGETFKQLSSRHLRIHDLDAKSYRQKHSIPSTQSLSAKAATARRREIAQQLRPWEQAAANRAGAAKRAAKTRRGGR